MGGRQARPWLDSVSYAVEVLPAAARAMRKLPPEARTRVAAAIELLGNNPRPPAAKRLTGRPEWRVRTGDYRVLYRIEDSILTVVIVHAGHRREVYER